MQLVHQILPTSSYLYFRHIIPSPLCSLCEEYDDIKHWLFDCQAFAHFRSSVKWINWKEIDFIQFLCNPSYSNNVISKIACLLWNLWLARNNAIFRNTSINYVGIIKASEQLYNQHITTNLVKHPGLNNSVVHYCL